VSFGNILHRQLNNGFIPLHKRTGTNLEGKGREERGDSGKREKRPVCVAACALATATPIGQDR